MSYYLLYAVCRKKYIIHELNDEKEMNFIKNNIIIMGRSSP